MKWILKPFLFGLFWVSVPLPLFSIPSTLCPVKIPNIVCVMKRFKGAIKLLKRLQLKQKKGVDVDPSSRSPLQNRQPMMTQMSSVSNVNLPLRASAPNQVSRRGSGVIPPPPAAARLPYGLRKKHLKKSHFSTTSLLVVCSLTLPCLFILLPPGDHQRSDAGAAAA